MVKYFYWDSWLQRQGTLPKKDTKVFSVYIENMFEIYGLWKKDAHYILPPYNRKGFRNILEQQAKFL